MEITNIRVRKVNSSGKLRALVSVTFDDQFAVHDMKVIEGENKLFIAMPSKQTPQEKYRDIAHPTNSDMREKLQSLILEEYSKVAAEQ